MTAPCPNRDTLLQLAQQLPASPQVLLHLSELLTDVNSGLNDVADLLRRDTALAARVIRISNSVAYGMGGRVGTVEDAVNRVGYAEIYRLVGLATAAQLGELNLAAYGISGSQLRDNTLVTALVSEALAARTGADARVVYTAGLLRSTGKLVLDRLARRGPPIDALHHSADLLKWERGAFGCTNLDVAEIVLGGWRFPSALTHPVRHHVFPAGCHSDWAPACVLLHIASGSVRDAGFGLPGEQEYWDVSASSLQAAGLSVSSVRECSEEGLAAFDLIKSSL